MTDFPLLLYEMFPLLSCHDIGINERTSKQHMLEGTSGDNAVRASR